MYAGDSRSGRQRSRAHSIQKARAPGGRVNIAMPADAPSVLSTCPYCGVGCGVRLTPSEQGQAVGVRGDTDHPANLGRLCSKGTHLGETVGLEGRHLYPTIGGQRAEWSDALNYVAR